MKRWFDNLMLGLFGLLALGYIATGGWNGILSVSALAVIAVFVAGAFYVIRWLFRCAIASFQNVSAFRR
jgi:hypothetical protein